MNKSKTINSTDFGKSSTRDLERMLDTYSHVSVTHYGDPIFELHPPGTGDQLRALSEMLGELCDAEAGSIFRVLGDGSIERPAQVDDDPDA